MSDIVICLMGPTCSGKTDLALQLETQFPVEIISVDSVMVYRGLDIGTAKPSLNIRKKVPHHLIDIRDPKDSYSAGDFCTDALALIESCFSRKKCPLLVGGTMLYYRALQQGLSDLPSKNETIRTSLMLRQQCEGTGALHEALSRIDPGAASRINSNDAQRIIRALEIYLVSGKTLSAHWREPVFRFPYDVVNVGLIPDRALLGKRIAQRFETMLHQGFLEEVRALMERGDLNPALPAIKSVGYKQVWEYLSGEGTRNEMKEKAIIATRQLAKRQFTWLRSWPDLTLFSPEETNCFKKVEEFILSRI